MEKSTAIHNGDEIEIDLLELFRALKRKVWIILLAAVIGGGFAGAFSKLVLTPKYQSTAMVYILSKETTLTSLADLQMGSQLTKDYKVIVVSRPVLEDVIEGLGLDLSYRDLKKKLTIDNPADTRILSITAQDPDPYLAKKIADAVANTASSYIGDIMEMVPPKMIENGEVPQKKFSPSNGKNAVLGALAAIVVVCGVIVLEVIMNDTIVTEDDVAKYLGLSVLASVPERSEAEGNDADEITRKKGTFTKKKQSRRKRR